VDASHREFSSKFDKSSSCEEYLPVSSNKNHSHGTTCAALSAGSANNGLCSVGIAPDATLSACRVFGENITEEANDDSYLYLYMERMHISSNSYGISPCTGPFIGRRLQVGCPFSADAKNSPCSDISCAGLDWSNPQPSLSCTEAISRYCQESFENDPGCVENLDLYVRCSFSSMPETTEMALEKGINEGREGKGIIYVFSSGNDFALGSDLNFEGTRNSRLTISVGAVGKDGKHSSYSRTGAAIFISAPGGDHEFYRNNVVALAGGGCSDYGVGTSFAVPVVSGVVALVLQVNQGLTWRDVQGILALTSQKIEPNDSSWATNTAGFHHSYKYGFGLVDASAAVKAAKNWVNYSPEQEIKAQSGLIDLLIAEYPADPISSKVTIVASDAFVTESVVVYLNLTHSSRGDLNITLTSPSGTQSLLSPGKRPENGQTDEYWKLLTVRNWGESVGGEWTISLVDEAASDCIDNSDWVVIAQGLELDCWLLAKLPTPLSAYCEIPQLADENGVTPDVACCACGGGTNASEFANMLRNWELTVYGHVPVS
jgi:subtilisin-like proprotein convertase family protein